MKILFVVLFIYLCSAKLFEEFLLQERNSILQGPPPGVYCSDIYWGNNGEDCDPSRNSKKRCKIFYSCIKNKCSYGNVGRKCELDTDCFLNDPLVAGIRCVKNVCTKPKYNGEPCVENRSCFNNQCVNGICVGKKENEVCDPTKLVQCGPGLYCDLYTKVCTPQLNEGVPCNYFGESNEDDSKIEEGSNYMVVCKGGLRCTGPYGRKACLRWRGGDVGAPCNYNRDGNIGCRFGLFCSPTEGKCGNYRDTYPSYLCNGASRNCTYADNEDCICDKSNNNQPTCKKGNDMNLCGFNKVANEYRNCVTKFNCPFEKNFFTSWLVDSLEKESCAGKNCGHLVKDLMCCAFEKYRREKYTWVSVGPLGCGDNSSIIIVIVVILLVLGCVALLVVGVALTVVGLFLWKRKKDMDNGFQDLDQVVEN